MSTRERDASAVWSELRGAWPDLSWAEADFRHGAFHHVAVLGGSGVVRVSFAPDHTTRMARQVHALHAVGRVGLRTRIPRVLQAWNGDSWSAMACTVVPGEHDGDRSWEGIRDDLARILADLRSATVSDAQLPPARAWCGGDSWPDLVDEMTAELDPAARHAARSVVRDVLALDGMVGATLVHGDFGPHNLLWDEAGDPGLIDFDHTAVGDPAIDVAPLIGFYGAAKVGEIVDVDVLERAKTYRASLPLHVAAAARIGADGALENHALGNFVARLEAGTLHDPAA